MPDKTQKELLVGLVEMQQVQNKDIGEIKGDIKVILDRTT